MKTVSMPKGQDSRPGSLRLGFGLVLTGMCSLVFGQAERVHRYTVSIDQALENIEVRACFSGRAPDKLVASSLDASAALEIATVDGGAQVTANGPELALGTLPDNSCLRYRVTLRNFVSRHQRGGSPTRRVGRDLLTDADVWLWRIPPLPGGDGVELQFNLPAGISASAPWPRARDSNGTTVYRLTSTPPDWPAAVAFGRFTEQTVTIAGADLHVSILDGRPAVDHSVVLSWLERAAGAVASVYGRFPAASLQVVVIPGARGSEPVPFAYVLRGGGPAVHFYINQRKSKSAFFSDWSAVHEFSHLLLPFVQSQDAWLPEGLASYYQNVLRARAGMLTQHIAWEEMERAFRRAHGAMAGITLAQATQRMYGGGDFMRVYWEGAAIMFLADQRLRQRTAGRQSLDSVLAGLRRCCASSQTEWRAVDLFRRLDEIAGHRIFTELYDEYVDSDRFPDVATAYRLLGVGFSETGTLRLYEDAPQKADRDAIMTMSLPMPPDQERANEAVH